jgi:hypothetical protein
MPDQDAQGPNELVKITIRLPRHLVQTAKLHAMGLGEDLQDLVQRALTENLRGKDQRERVQTAIRDANAKTFKRATSYTTKKTRGAR